MPHDRSLRRLTLQVQDSGRFIADDRDWLAIDDLRIRSSMDVTGMVGRSVLIKTTKQLPTVLAAIELDGIAGRIVLCTPDQWHHLPSLLAMAQTDIIVTDEPDGSFPMARVGPLDFPVWQGNRHVQTEWILLTSGTTGLPKMVVHTLASLAGPLEDGLVATGSRWSTWYDIRRYGGLQMLLRALLGGGSMILSSETETAAEFLNRVGEAGVTHISGTPSHWRKALMSPAANAMTPAYVRLSGEAVDQAILDHLAQTYPDANIGHAFASTEAGVAFDVRDGKAGFPASYIGDPSLKAELRVEGTLHIRSSRTARSYIDRPLNGENGWVDTGDLVRFRDDRYYFAGRREGVINVGGQKVYPEEVENILIQHPAIQMARVWGRKSPIIGALVAADLILQHDLILADVRDDVIAHCRRHLQAWKVPGTLRQVESIPLSAAGKISRA